MKNEQGSALVIVLLSITIMLTLGTLLISQSISTAKQREQTETSYRATHLAEYGVVYVKEFVEKYISYNPISPDENLNEYISNLVNDLLQQSENSDIDPNYSERSFSVSFLDIKDIDDVIVLTFEIIGKDGEKERKLVTDFILNAHYSSDNGSFEQWEKQIEQIPQKPNEGVAFDSWVDWKNENYSFNDNLILNGGQIKNSEVSSKDFYTTNSIFIENSSLNIDGFAKFDYFQIRQNTEVDISEDMYVTNYLENTNGNPTLKACGNSVFYNGLRFRGELIFGKHVIINNRMTLKNASFTSGGSVYLKGGMDIENGSTSLIVGGDLIFNQSAGSSTINTSKDLIVLGNLILKNVPKNQGYLFELKNNILVTGDVFVYFQGESNPTKNPEDIFFSPIIREYGKGGKKGSIIYHYPNSQDINIKDCTPPNDTPNDISLDVVLDQVKY